MGRDKMFVAFGRWSEGAAANIYTKQNNVLFLINAPGTCRVDSVDAAECHPRCHLILQNDANLGPLESDSSLA
ncbi:hypothetical protein pipiens_015449 [Culex pipiens pipiens]|uniref:Uncharacterized protein n=1 Tax=Culex pipiens pipiens TaxID=38569 RepID=A0ABD1CQW7_CULPP